MTAGTRRAWLGLGLGWALWALPTTPLHAAPLDRPADEALAQNLPHANGGDHSAAERAALAHDEGAELVEVAALFEAPEGREVCDADPQDTQKDRKHKWWSSPEGRAEFGLTEAQSRDLEAIFQSMLPEMRVSKAEVDRYQQQLTKLLSEASAREPVVLKAIDQLETAQSALSRTRTIMLYRMYRLLSPEQRAKVQAYYDRKAKEPDSQSVRR